MKNYAVILTTFPGRKYGRKIGKELRKLGIISFYCSLNRWPNVFRDHPELNKDNCVIVARCAHPNNSPNWMKILEDMEEDGWTIINNTNVLKLTSNKLQCSLFLQDKVNHPKSWECTKRNFEETANNLNDGTYIVKPYVSQSQGRYVKKFFVDEDADFLIDANTSQRLNIDEIPENKLVIQEFINYVALYRVIVINGRALPFSFVDRPTQNKWKVSVCLNRTSMEYVPNPNPELLRLGEQTQREIGGNINYIDIFEKQDRSFVISEINTSCILFIHERLSGKNIAREIAKGIKQICLQ